MRKIAIVGFVFIVTLGLTTLAESPARASGFSVTSLHFDVPGTGNSRCDIVGDVYVPTGTTHDNPAPAVLTTNGFSGSKDTQAPVAKMFAARGYVVLAYSGLGFGGSGCRVTFDNPVPDGRAASRLVSYLGGDRGIAYLDAAHTRPAPVLTSVQRDTVDHSGVRRNNDPRVGMFGGSYGGQIQFAAASVDPRIDTIMPMVTWNDLAYSLAPNNTGQTIGVTTRTQGAAKLNWSATFVAAGVMSGLSNPTVDPVRLTGCPNFPPEACEALAQTLTTGTVDNAVINEFHQSSVASYLDRIRIPTLLVQGQRDTLFNLNESIATYQGLTTRGVPTKMIWMYGGHSGPSAKGEIDSATPNTDTQYVTRRMSDWLDHYLKGTSASTGPDFAYFRDWVGYQGIATPAYATADGITTGAEKVFRLSGAGGLTTASPQPGVARFTTAPGGLPTSHDVPDGLGLIGLPENDIPGTFAQWDSGPLTQQIAVVGSPKVRLRINTPTRANAPLAEQPILFLRIADIDPSGNATTVQNLVAPVRISDPSQPFTVTMPAFVHRFSPGHRLRLIVSGGSTNYRGGLTATPISIRSGADQVLTLPST